MRRCWPSLPRFCLDSLFGPRSIRPRMPMWMTKRFCRAPSPTIRRSRFSSRLTAPGFTCSASRARPCASSMRPAMRRSRPLRWGAFPAALRSLPPATGSLSPTPGTIRSPSSIRGRLLSSPHGALARNLRASSWTAPAIASLSPIASPMTLRCSMPTPGRKKSACSPGVEQATLPSHPTAAASTARTSIPIRRLIAPHPSPKSL